MIQFETTWRFSMKSELINFRDFGGYPTQDGRFIKEAIFFRCGSYRDLTEEDRDYIRSLNIQNLCDYREVSELDRDELRETFAKKVYTISASEHLGGFEDDKNLPYTALSSEDMEIFYTKLVFDNPAYINVFQILQEENSVPYLHNCTAGKDRTGVGTALIQLALGMSEEDVLFDFLKSIQAFDAIVENEVRRLKYGRSIETLYHKMPGLIVKPSYLNAALDTIKAKHGTYDAYFEAEYGLTADKIAALRDRFTETR